MSRYPVLPILDVHCVDNDQIQLLGLSPTGPGVVDAVRNTARFRFELEWGHSQNHNYGHSHIHSCSRSRSHSPQQDRVEPYETVQLWWVMASKRSI